MPRHISVGQSAQSLHKAADDGISQIYNEYIRICLWIEHRANELHSDYNQCVEEPSKQPTKPKKKVGIKDKENVENSQPKANIPDSAKSDPPITSENPRRSGRKKTQRQPTLSQAIDHSGETSTESSTSQEWQLTQANESSNSEIIHTEAEPITAVVNNPQGSDQSRKQSAGNKSASVKSRNPSLDKDCSSKHETKIDPITQVPSSGQILTTPPKHDSLCDQKPSIVSDSVFINTEASSYKAETKMPPASENETPSTIVNSVKVDVPTKLEKRKSPDSGSRHSHASSESSASKKQFSSFIPAQPVNVTNESFQSAVSTIPVETGNAATPANHTRKDSVVVIPDTPASQAGADFSTPLSTPARQHTPGMKGKVETENARMTESVARILDSARGVHKSIEKALGEARSNSSKLTSPHTSTVKPMVGGKISVLSPIPLRTGFPSSSKQTITPAKSSKTDNTPKSIQTPQTSTDLKQMQLLVTPSQPTKVMVHPTPKVEVVIAPESGSDYESADEGVDTVKRAKSQTPTQVTQPNPKTESTAQPASKKPANSDGISPSAGLGTDSEMSESTSGSTATGEISLVSSDFGSSTQFPGGSNNKLGSTVNKQPTSTPIPEASGIHNPDRKNPIPVSSTGNLRHPHTPHTPVHNKSGLVKKGNLSREQLTPGEPKSPFVQPVTPHSPHTQPGLMAEKMKENATIQRDSYNSENTLHHSIISGYKESDDEDDLDDEDISPKKSRRPKWASPSKILRALRNETRNPEDIFFVESIPREVNLEEIFGTPPNSAKRTIYSKR